MQSIKKKIIIVIFSIFMVLIIGMAIYATLKAFKSENENYVVVNPQKISDDFFEQTESEEIDKLNDSEPYVPNNTQTDIIIAESELLSKPHYYNDFEIENVVISGHDDQFAVAGDVKSSSLKDGDSISVTIKLFTDKKTDSYVESSCVFEDAICSFYSYSNNDITYYTDYEIISIDKD